MSYHPTMRPADCAPWCADGDGHTGEWCRADQRCASDYSSTELSLVDVLHETTGAKGFFASSINVAAIRPWKQYPCVELHIEVDAHDRPSADISLPLTPGEARNLARDLLQYAALIDDESQEAAR